MSGEYQAFPDAEAICGWKLRGADFWDDMALDPRVYSVVPPDAEYPLIRIERIGGLPRERHRLDGPRIQVSVWGAYQTQAHDLAAAARVALHELEGSAVGDTDDCPVEAFVAAVSDDLALQFLPDPLTGKDRYIFGVQLVTHARSAAS